MQIRKLFRAEMAHSVPGAYTKRCNYLHGHSYKFEVFLRSDSPNSSQMVVDFRAAKDMGLNDLYDSFDHSVMLWARDPVARLIQRVNPKRHLIVPFTPTAEMIAKACFVVSQAIIQTGASLSGEAGVIVERVIVHETETGYGSFSVSDVGNDRFPAVDFPKWRISAGVQSEWKNKAWFKKALAYLKRNPA